MTKTVYINRFDSGVYNDPRTPIASGARANKNFDALTNRYKLTPYHDPEDGDSGASTSQKQNFAIALRTGTTYSLYSLGVKSGTGTAEVLYKDLTTGASNDLDDNTWSTPSANQSASGTANFEMFCYYKNQGKIYGLRGSRYLWAFSPDGTAWADSVYDYGSAADHVTEGLVHPKDDIMYWGMDNKVISKDGSGSASIVLTLPNYLYVSSLCVYGNYLAIMAAPVNGLGGTVVYLWDRDASLANLPEIIEWGAGVGKIIAAVDGTLVGISRYGGNSSRFTDHISFKYYDGIGARELQVIEGGTSTQLLSAKQIIDNRVWFMMGVTLDGTFYAGTWSFGKNRDGAFTLNFERTINGDTAFATDDVLKGFIKVGDYLFQSSVVDSSYTLTKTDDQVAYLATAQWDTLINPGMDDVDDFANKRLLAIALMYEPLPSAGQVILQYRVDGGSWTTIFTETTDNAVKTEHAGPFTAGKEYEFRIKSTGGAEITGLLYQYKREASQLTFPNN